MKERPIIFNTEMVKAILEGRKTQTRRPFKLLPDPRYPEGYDTSNVTHIMYAKSGSAAKRWVPIVDAGEWPTPRLCPFGVPGDRLWVRETFYCGYWDYPNGPRDTMTELLEYRADHECRTWEAGCPCQDENGRSAWRPSIHMPRWASRLTLDIKNVWVEPVQEIGEDCAIAEGVQPEPLLNHRGEVVQDMDDYESGFAKVWDRIYAAKGYAWSANPWVWAVEFDVGEA